MAEANDKPRKPDAETADRLRDQIDRGGTGDKVAFSDPAAAPLGTDDEAAGHSPTPDQVRTAMRHETDRAQSAETKPTPADLQETGPSQRSALAIAAVVLAALAVVILFL